MSLTEVNQLRKALKVAQARAEKAGLLEYEVRELRKDLQGAEIHKETIGSQNREIVRLVCGSTSLSLAVAMTPTRRCGWKRR